MNVRKWHHEFLEASTSRIGCALMKNELNRRSALKSMAVAGGSLVLPLPAFANGGERPKKQIRLGVIADLHGGLAKDADARLDAFLDAMKDRDCDALVQLGDFAFPNEKHQRFADKFNSAHETTLHVIGNHEFDYGLTREDCCKAWGIKSSYYRRDIEGVRILILDGNDEGSPTHGGGYASYIGKLQQEWLRRELKGSDLPIVIFSHQPLAGMHAVDNAKDIQQLLAKHKSKIILCLNGHTHIDLLEQVDDVPYLHLNSASYYWVGGKTRMAYYRDPLFSVVTIDPENAKVTIEGKSTEWKGESPLALGYFDQERLETMTVVTPRIRDQRVTRNELSVMSWNIWGRLNQEPRYTINNKTARQRVVDIIRESGVDVVGMIETYGSALDIARELGYHYHTPAWDANLCIFSRYPLSDVEPLKGLNPFSFTAATITMPGGRQVRLYNIWLTSGGRHLVEIKNKEVSDEAFTLGDENRFKHLQQLLSHEDFKKWLRTADQVPVIVAGDFNCVSHLDHTKETQAAHLNHSRALAVKASKAMAELGFTDTYRAANPKLTAESLGHTWTTVGKDYMYESGKGFVPVKGDNHPRPEYRDPYARIDYIYSIGKEMQVVDSDVIRNHPAQPKRSFPEFPSDHAAVVTRFRFASK